MLRVTGDSNIIVSGLNFSGNPHRFLAAAEAGIFQLCVSPEILAEVVDVLQRDKIGSTESEAKEATDWISQISNNVVPTEPVDIVEEDPSDNRILECAAAGSCDYIIF